MTLARMSKRVKKKMLMRNLDEMVVDPVVIGLVSKPGQGPRRSLLMLMVVHNLVLDLLSLTGWGPRGDCMLRRKNADLPQIDRSGGMHDQLAPKVVAHPSRMCRDEMPSCPHSSAQGLLHVSQPSLQRRMA